MAKLLTPDIVGARMLAEAKRDVEYKTRLLTDAQNDLLSIRLELSDVPSKWVEARKVVLEDQRYYFLQSVCDKRPIGDVCLAKWRYDYGWLSVIGRIIESRASGANLLVLVPKGEVKRGGKTQKAQKARKRR